MAVTLGEALEIEPFAWEGELVPGDRLALLSRNLAHVVGLDELHETLGSMHPVGAAAHLQRRFAERGGRGSEGLLLVEIEELAAD